METAYGYGGFIVSTCEEKFIKEALNEYINFCKSQNIVAEFIRFHPFNNCVENLGKSLNFFKKDRIVIYIDLHKPKQYEGSLKRNIKKALSYNLRFAVLEKNKENLDKFITMYYKTMKKNKANSFYFFSKEYFEKLFALNESKLFGTFLEGKLVNAIVVLESSLNIAYYHLGATEPEYYSYNVNPFIFDKVIDFYKEKGFKYLYLGGGTDSSPNNSLLRFKKKFSKNFRWYFIGGLVFNSEIYEILKKKYCFNSKFLCWRK